MKLMRNLVLVLCAWFAIVSAATLAREPEGAVMAIFPFGPSGVRLSDGLEVLEWPGRIAYLSGNRPGFVLEAYRSGAVIVLPVRRRTCLALSSQE